MSFNRKAVFAFKVRLDAGGDKGPGMFLYEERDIRSVFPFSLFEDATVINHIFPSFIFTSK